MHVRRSLDSLTTAGQQDRYIFTLAGNAQLYFDSLVFTAEGLRHLIAETGINQIVLGTDYPFPWTSTAVEHILEIPGLSDEDRIAILGGTAAKLLNL